MDIAALRRAIKRQMATRGLSSRRLSGAAGLSESAVRDLLSRTDNPGIATLNKIADALDVPLQELMFGDPDDYSHEILEIWAHIPEERRSHAKTILESFSERMS